MVWGNQCWKVDKGLEEDRGFCLDAVVGMLDTMIHVYIGNNHTLTSIHDPANREPGASVIAESSFCTPDSNPQLQERASPLITSPAELLAATSASSSCGNITGINRIL